MSSVVSICNIALGQHLGKRNITALTEASTEARYCNQFYEQSRDMLLQSYPWSFAGKTASLAEVANDKLGRWGYAYRRPNDCLKVRWVRPEYSETECGPMSLQEELRYPYEIEGETIYCNLSPAYLRYTWAITDPTKFPPAFVDALAASLAARLAYPITKDRQLRNEMAQLARQLQITAETLDANEERNTSDHVSDFEEARG